MIWAQLLLVTVFILVHLFSGKLRFLDVIPRSRWLSMSSGISVAYVFIHILPRLEAAQRTIGEGEPVLPFIEHHAYLVALFGLVLFYGLERIIKNYHQPAEQPEDGETSLLADDRLFWLHISSFAILNALIGYLLIHREEQDLQGLLFFGAAMALHFLVTDYGLRQDHRDSYRQVGRWVLSAAVLLGWLAGLAIEVSGAGTSVLFAFLAGGVILNVLKEELPQERQSRFLPFALGAAAYAALLLL